MGGGYLVQKSVGKIKKIATNRISPSVLMQCLTSRDNAASSNRRRALMVIVIDQIKAVPIQFAYEGSLGIFAHTFNES